MSASLCLDCEKPLMGRVDKKFCDDNCRNNFNNKRNRDTNNLVRNVNGILRRNRRVLEKLVPDEKRKVKKSTLDTEGFNYQYFTNTYQTKTGQTYYFCYDYGYLPLEDDYYLLVHRKE